MKLKVILGACLWTLLITVAHVHYNVGWERFASKTREFLGWEREELIVGFLPVT
ncbi:MAG: hypothetical protein P8N09_00620 [Planctomycetota bacterium]|nr:hypothetical protein [Planctomycetota bacterium]